MSHQSHDRGHIFTPLSPTIAKSIVKLLQPIVKQFDREFRHNCDRKIPDAPIAIPVRRVPTTGYRYVSAIAHTLSGRYKLPPLTIANTLHSDLLALDVVGAEGLGLWLSLGDAGYLYWDLSPLEIAGWLEYLHRTPPQIELKTFSPSPLNPSLELAMYARDRCRSVLRLAHSHNFIDLDRDWNISTPTPTFVCDAEHHYSVNLRQDSNLPCHSHSFPLFEDYSEIALIHALMDVLDGIYSDRGIAPAKLAIDLAQAWLEFHRYCRMWGDVKIHRPHLAIARLGLTAIAGRYLDILIMNN
jgi:hypothetical protein